MAREDYLRRSPIKFDDADYQVCYAYWCRLKGERSSPEWRDWDWMQLPVKLIPYFIVVDVIYEPRDIIYRYWGTASANMHGIELTGKSVNDIRSSETKKTIAQYEEVIECHEAIGAAYVVQAGKYAEPHVRTILRMPFSDDGERVTQIATYCDWSKDLSQIRDEFIQEFGDPAN